VDLGPSKCKKQSSQVEKTKQESLLQAEFFHSEEIIPNQKIRQNMRPSL